MEPLNVIEDVCACLGARSALPTVHSFALEHFEKAFLPALSAQLPGLGGADVRARSVTRFRFGVSVAKSGSQRFSNRTGR